MKEKLIYLRKLEALEKKGVSLTKKYSMDSPLSEMKGEFEMIKAEKEKKNSIKFLGFLGFLGSCFSLGSIDFEVLVRFPFQKYITSWVFLASEL